MHKVLHVDGMTCGSCINTIQGALKDLCTDVKVDLSARTVTVEFDEGKVSLDSIKKAIENSGYKVQ